MKISNFDNTQPYAFVSYKSGDGERVKADIQLLQTQYGVNIWFDENLTSGEHWDEEVVPVLTSASCKLAIFYASPDAIASVNVQKEISLIKRLEIPLLPINFSNDSFKSAFRSADQSRYANNKNFNINGGLDLIDNHLPNSLTYIRLQSADCYDQIVKSIRKLAPDIIKIGHVPAVTKAEPAKAEPLRTEQNEVLQTPIDTSAESESKNTLDDWRDVFSKHLTDALKAKSDIHFCGNSTRSRISFNTTFMRNLFDAIAPRDWEKENNFNWQIQVRLDPNKIIIGPVFAGNQMRSDAERKKAEEIWLAAIDANKKFKPSWQWLSKDINGRKEADIDDFIKSVENDVDAGKEWVLRFSEEIMIHVQAFEQKLKLF